MSPHGRDKGKRAGRPPFGSVPRPPIVFVVSEGKVTEPAYFGGLYDSLKDRKYNIKFHPKKGDPKQLVEHAIGLKLQQLRQGDAVWCVCDVDDHARLPDAVQQARDNQIDFGGLQPLL